MMDYPEGLNSCEWPNLHVAGHLARFRKAVVPLTIPPLTSSIRISMKQPVPDRHPENAQIEPRSPVRDVVEVELHAFA